MPASIRYSLLALAVCSLPLAGQRVSGTVVDPAGRAVAGVVVTLLDSASAVTGRALSSEVGAFSLSALRPGVYRIRTIRIGFAPQISDAIRLDQGTLATQRIILTAVRLVLDTVRVSGGASQCRPVARDSTGVAFRLLEQARAALTAAQMTGGQRTIASTTVGYDRVVDRQSRRIKEQTASAFTEFVTQPWASLSPDRLRKDGYVVQEGGFTTYHAPGLDALTADSFLQDHCIKLSTSDDPTLIGVGFEPNRSRRDFTEITGTIWIDRASSELRRIEYRYANVSKLQEENAGGTIELAVLNNGMWVISKWNIRMPVMTLSPKTLTSAAEVRITEIRVRGGELVAARRGKDTLWARPPMRLAGVVSDSLSGRPIGGARVALGGTSVAAVTDAAGRFAIADVLAGIYTLETRTPSLDSVGAVHQTRLVFTDPVNDLSIRMLTAEQMASAFCPDQRGAKGGVIVGTVAARGDTINAPGVSVVAQWKEIALRGTAGSVIDQPLRSITARTDAAGGFRLCGIPTETAVTVYAETGEGKSETVGIRLEPGAQFARAALVINKRPSP